MNNELKERVESLNKGLDSLGECHVILGVDVRNIVNDLATALEQAEAENKRLEGRDCQATIELCYDDGDNPFARESLKVVDVGVADNVYIVESQLLNTLLQDHSDG